MTWQEMMQTGAGAARVEALPADPRNRVGDSPRLIGEIELRDSDPEGARQWVILVTPDLYRAAADHSDGPWDADYALRERGEFVEEGHAHCSSPAEVERVTQAWRHLAAQRGFTQLYRVARPA